MLLEIIQGMEAVVRFVPVLVIIWTGIIMIRGFIKSGFSVTKGLKTSFCISLTVLFFVAMLMFSMFQLLLIGNLWTQYEVEEGTVVEPWIKEISYLGSDVFIFFLGALFIMFIWKTFYKDKIIPGEGNLKERIIGYFRRENNET